MTFAMSYGECLDHFLTSSEMIECGGPELLYTQESSPSWLPHRIPAEDMSNLLLESSPVVVHLAFIGLSIDLCSSRFPGFSPRQAQD